MGVIGTYVDDVAYTGLTVGAPEEVQPQRGADAAETVVGPALPDDEFERHTSEEDGVARDPLLLDGVDQATALPVRARFLSGMGVILCNCVYIRDGSCVYLRERCGLHCRLGAVLRRCGISRFPRT